MRAMVLKDLQQPLQKKELLKPFPGPDQLLIRVHTCGVCRTDLHIVDGELPHPKLPLVLGHQIVGIVEAMGQQVKHFKIGERVGVPWIGGTCGHCSFCQIGSENLCPSAIYTGYQTDGGFAEYCVAKAHFCFPIPEKYKDLEVAPLLCAGLIGYRAFRMTGRAKRIGFYGFGSAAHILTQLALFQGKEIYAFTRPDDKKAQEFALSLGAVWAGSAEQAPPVLLDAAIIFAPSGALVPLALKAIDKGGSVICAGIHMSKIPSFSYDLLYGERILRSVANLTRQDGVEFLTLASNIPIQTSVATYPLEEVNQALEDLRSGKITGSAVIQVHRES